MRRNHLVYWPAPPLRGWLYFPGLLGLMLASATLFQAQDSTGTIYGRVTDSRGQAQRLMVHLFADGEMPAGAVYTGTEGQFAFQMVPGGEYWVVAEGEGFKPARQSVRLDIHTNPNAQVNLSLESASAAVDSPGPMVSGSPSSRKVDVKKSSPSFNARAVSEYAKGNARQTKGDTKGAIAHYEKAIRIDPLFYPALNNLGGAYESQGEHQRAEAALMRALEINPSDAQSYVNLGHVLYEEGRYGEARTRLEEAIRRSPNSATARFLLGSANLKLGDLASAESNLKQACLLAPKGLPAAHLQLANVYLRSHDLAAARKELEDYLRANPDDPQAPAIRKLLVSTQSGE